MYLNPSNSSHHREISTALVRWHYPANHPRLDAQQQAVGQDILEQGITEFHFAGKKTKIVTFVKKKNGIRDHCTKRNDPRSKDKYHVFSHAKCRLSLSLYVGLESRK